MRGHLLVMRQVHGVNAAATAHRAQVVAIADHLRQRHLRVHDALVAFAFHPLHAAAPCVQVAHDVAHHRFRHGDADIHDGFLQHRPGIAEGLAEALAARNLKGDVLRINRMFLTIEDNRLHIHYREAGDNAFRQHGLNALVDGRQEGVGNCATVYLRLVFVAVADVGLQAQADFGELTGATGLLLVTVCGLAGAGDGLLVGHAWHPGVQVDAQPLCAADSQLHVRLAHAFEQGLARVAIMAPAQRRVRAGQIAQDGAHARAIRLGARRDGHHVERRGQLRPVDLQVRSPGAEGIAGARVGELGDDADVARMQYRNVALLLAPHDDQRPEAFVASSRAVVIACIRLHRTGEDAEEGKRTDVTVVNGLEHPGNQRPVVFPRGHQLLRFFPLALQLDAASARLRTIGDQRLQQRNGTDILRRRGHEDGHGHEIRVAGRLAHAVANLLVAEVAFLKVLFDQRVVRFSGCLDQLKPRHLNFFLHLFRQIRALCARAKIGLLRQQVNHAREFGLHTHGQHDRDELEVREARPQAVQRAIKIGVFPVQLVDDNHDGLMAGTGVFPGQFGADFHTSNCVNHYHN